MHVNSNLIEWLMLQAWRLVTCHMSQGHIVALEPLPALHSAMTYNVASHNRWCVDRNILPAPITVLQTGAGDGSCADAEFTLYSSASGTCSIPCCVPVPALTVIGSRMPMWMRNPSQIISIMKNTCGTTIQGYPHSMAVPHHQDCRKFCAHLALWSQSKQV